MMYFSLLTVTLITLISISHGFTDTNVRCQDDRGRLLPVATFCEDDRKDCALIFQGFAHDYFRPYLCDKSVLKPTALQCAKTCGICCERFEFGFGDSDSVH